MAVEIWKLNLHTLSFKKEMVFLQLKKSVIPIFKNILKYYFIFASNISLDYTEMTRGPNLEKKINTWIVVFMEYLIK